MQKFRKFVSVEEARTWGEKCYSYWLPRYQPGGALRHYYELEDIEQLLPGDFSLEECEQLKRDALENIWGYRFLDYKDLCRSINKGHISCGTRIQDKGYMGVGLVKDALKEEWGTYNTLLKILIPQGSKGLYIDLISNRCNEQEVLFARNSRLKVLFRYRCTGKRVLVCRLIK